MATSLSPVRFAVVGLGHFAQVAVLPAMKRLKDVELAALVSGDPEKRAVLGDQYSVERRCDYGELEALLQSKAIDAGYIATPNDTHAEYCMRAARHGVHVLCEKPMAPTSSECEAMIDVAEAHDVRLMIAYRLHFESGNLSAIAALEAGKIGEPRIFNSVFTLQVRPDNTRVQKRAGAGPLYDIGTYCINAARSLFRAEPLEVMAQMARRPDDPRFRHTEETVAATMRFSDERLASFVVGFGSYATAEYKVIGTEGGLTVDCAYEYVDDITLTIRSHGETSRQTFQKRDQIAAEISYFADCVRNGIEPEPSGYEGLADVRVIEAIQASAASGEGVAVDPVLQQSRPDLGQALRVPPHGKPRTVHVHSGSLS